MTVGSFSSRESSQILSLVIATGIIFAAIFHFGIPVAAGESEAPCFGDKDTHLDQQWGWFSINSDSAWKRGFSGENITIGIFDTGVNIGHPDLEGVEVVFKHNYIDGNDDVSDKFGHGTHVAGIIAATTNNGEGVAGVSPKVNLAVFKVINNEGQLEDLNEAIEDANDMDIDVYSMSLGGHPLIWPGGRMNLFEAYRNGTVIVAAAGNDNSTDIPEPASYDFTISVGAINEDNERAYFSNYGPDLDLMAPGHNVLSTYISNPPSDYPDPTYTNPPYVSLTGTSMATPHVTGVVALLLGEEPGLTPDQVRSRLENTATYLGDPYYYGSGLVNAEAALGIEGMDASPPGPPSGLVTLSVTSSEINLDWDGNPEKDLSFYRVYRSDTPGFNLESSYFVGKSTTSEFLDTGLEENTNYYYKVTAVDRSCNESDSSDEVIATTDESSGPVTGDVNWDGKVDILDALQIVRYDARLHPSPFYVSVADVRGCDGTVDVLDALSIAQYDANLISEFDCGSK